MAPRVEGSAAQPLTYTRHRYHAGPELSEVRQASATLMRGHSGGGVRDMQAALNAAGIQPRLEEDGLFGPKTQAALRQFQANSGLPETGVLDTATLGALERARSAAGTTPASGAAPADDTVDPSRQQGSAPRAPQAGTPRPAGTVPAGQLARGDEARRQQQGSPWGQPRTPAPRATAPNAPAPNAPAPAPNAPAPNAPAPSAPSAPTPVRVDAPPGAARADAELAQIQSRTMDSARTALAAGVHEDHRVGDNRGAEIDRYARDAGMTPGGEWCGYFTSGQYSDAAHASGGTFEGRFHMHSMQKARSFFEYRSYTDNSSATNRRLDDLRTQQEADGSTRRWMTLGGSGGDRHASAHDRPHEVYEPSTLPIRAGDTALFSRGHVGLVENYDQSTGMLTTIEGNTAGGRVARHTYDLNDPAVRARFEGFGRPARGDFQVPSGS